MNTAHHLTVSVLLSLVLLTLGFDVNENVCSALISGILYRSFSLQDTFPETFSSCSWTVENPDPTKYSIYLKFHKEKNICSRISLMVLQLDHYIPNQTCSTLDYIDYDAINLCETRNLFTFLQFDKNFVQFCLTSESVLNEHLGKNAMEFQLLEVILLNNENSSQFGCGVLCQWLENCLSNRNQREPCGINESGCGCPDMHKNKSDSTTVLPFLKNEFISSKLLSRTVNELNVKNSAPKVGRRWN